MSLPARLLGANPSIQVSTLLSGSLSTPSAKQAFVTPGDYYSIASGTSSGSTASFTFSSIPQTFSHLRLRISCLAKTGGFNQNTNYVYPNSDTTSGNYTYHYIYRYTGDTTHNIASGTTHTGYFAGVNNGNSTPANPVSQTYNVTEIDIWDYTATDKFKTAFVKQYALGFTTSSQMFFEQASHIWKSSTAITSLLVRMDGVEQWANGSTVDLYGVK